MIAHKASQLFHNADEALAESGITDLTEEIIFIADHIINQFCEDKSLLLFISKNLSWGIFKSSLTNPSTDDEIDFYDIYSRILDRADYNLKDPEIMLFMIIELASSTCYSSILYEEPASIDVLKPYLYDSIRGIIKRHTISNPEDTDINA